MSQGYWFCPNCREEIGGYNVTYQELHDSCGYPVIWIEPEPFYETLDQWEARMSKKLSDKAQIWVRFRKKDHWGNKIFGYDWMNYEYGKTRGWRLCNLILVGGPEPPPDDWEELEGSK
jgi:hypothetical protein